MLFSIPVKMFVFDQNLIMHYFHKVYNERLNIIRFYITFSFEFKVYTFLA